MKPEEVESLFHRFPPVTPSPDLRERVLHDAEREAKRSLVRLPEPKSRPRATFLHRFWGSIPLVASFGAILAILVTIIVRVPASGPNPLPASPSPWGQETSVEKQIDELAD